MMMSAYELEEGDNPADNGDPIGDILEHVANKKLGLLSVILDNNVSFFYGNALSSERAIASSKRRFLAPVVWLEATERCANNCYSERLLESEDQCETSLL